MIGGTKFVGRAFVEQAVCHGHDVTVFHRSVSEPEDFPSVEHLHGDRDGQLDLLQGGSWDAVLDTCAYVPPGRCGRPALSCGTSPGTSRCSPPSQCTEDDMPAGSSEQTPARKPPLPADRDGHGGDVWPAQGGLRARGQEGIRRPVPNHPARLHRRAA